MKAMILAAGRGERMRPLTDDCPKPLLQVGSEPLIGHHLRRLAAAGVVDVVINHAWLGEKIEARLGDGEAYGVRITYSPEGGKGLETAGGIATALSLLGEEPFLVINGDVLTDIDFAAMAAYAHTLSEQGDWAHLWLVANAPHHPTGDFVLDDGRVRSEGEQGHRLTFSGVGVYHPCLFAHTPPYQPAKLAPLLRQAMADQRVGGQYHQGLWLDVGTAERLQQANKLAAAWRYDGLK